MKKMNFRLSCEDIFRREVFRTSYVISNEWNFRTIHQIFERRLSAITFLLVGKLIVMPKRKCCEHPTKHADSVLIPKGIIAASLQLSKFLVSRYYMTKTKPRWLCPRCHAFESNQMAASQAVQMNDDEVSSDDDDDDDDAMIVDVLDDCVANDDDHAAEESSEEEQDDGDAGDEEQDADDAGDQEQDADDADEEQDDDDEEEQDDDDVDEQDDHDEEEEDSALMDSGFMNESKENHSDLLDAAEDSTDCESMDEDEDAVSLEHEYQKNEAVEQLSTVFKLLKIEPIHDKYVVNLLLIF